MSKEEGVEVQEPKQAKRWSIGSIFWGLLLILIGVLFLLDNLEVITVNFGNVWQLWPVLIIGAGLSMLSLKSWLGTVVSVVAVLALLGLVTFAVVDNPWYAGLRSAGLQTTTETARAENAKKLDVTVDAGAATIVFASSAHQDGVSVAQESDGLVLEKTAETKDETRHIGFTSKSQKGFWPVSTSNTMNVTLTQALPVALHINTGATTVRGDLSQVRLTALDIDAGASSIDLRLGALEKRQEVSIDAGASNIVLYVPKQAGVRIESDSGLSSTSFEDINMLSDSTFESSGFSDAEKQIVVRADMGVSRFEIIRY